MRKSNHRLTVFPFVLLAVFFSCPASAATVSNPFLNADIPDPSIVRVGDKYYMSSTTMHMTPGVPVMESSDMVHWKTVSYVYKTFASTDALNLDNGSSAYGKGSWASSIRYKNGTFYVLFPSYTTNKTYLYSTQNIDSTPWKLVGTYGSLYHDCSLLLDDDGNNYIVYGSGDIKIVQLTSDLTAVKSGGVSKTLISSAQSITNGSSYYVTAEGSHIEKINGYYYIFNICWPAGASRTETIYRSQTLTGTYTGKVGLQSSGVAQGGIFQAADSSWWGLLFADNGAVGRSPWLVPVTWSSNWPVFNGGTAPSTISVALSSDTAGTGIVTSDDFTTATLFPEWQWNHNPDNAHWSLTARPGYYRITTSRTDASIRAAKNTLTQRTFGPKCSGRVALDVSGMKDGDVAGLAAFQDSLGYVGVKKSGSALSIVMVQGTTQEASVSISQSRVYLRIDMTFTSGSNGKAVFYYSLDSTTWKSIGTTLTTTYTLGMFMGYRFALFDYATSTAGGYADFDWFKIGSTVSEERTMHSTGTTSVQPTRSISVAGPLSFSRAVVRSQGGISIGYDLAQPGRVELLVADLSGRILDRIVDRRQEAGAHSVEYDASRFAEGRYLLLGRIDGTAVQTRSISLIR
jgi:beta-xylosidase